MKNGAKMRTARSDHCLGVKPINEIKILSSRHELSLVLPGLVHIYESKSEIIELIEKD